MQYSKFYIEVVYMFLKWLFLLIKFENVHFVCVIETN